VFECLGCPQVKDVFLTRIIIAESAPVGGAVKDESVLSLWRAEDGAVVGVSSVVEAELVRTAQSLRENLTSQKINRSHAHAHDSRTQSSRTHDSGTNH